MRKITAWILVLVMLLTAACALGETAPDLYDLYDRTEDGDTWLGNAIPILDGVVIASPAGLPETVSTLLVWDGSAYREITLVLSVRNGTLLVMLYETDGETPAIPEYDFIDATRDLKTQDLLVRSGDWLKSRINRAVTDASRITWQDMDCLLLTLSGDTAPGAPLLAQDGKLAGIVVAEYAEGENRYVALTINEISAGLLEASDLLSQPELDTRPEGYNVTLDGNLATFEWANVQLPEAGEGEAVYHVIADTENDYLTYLEVTPGTTEMTMLLTPGRMYISGFVVSAEAPGDLPEMIALTAVPEAEPLTEFNFHPVRTAIAEMAQDSASGDMPVPTDEVSESLLRSGRAFFYSCSTYEMEGRGQIERTLLVTLTAPDGNNYRWESGWYYAPELQEKDEWAVSLSTMEILDMLEQNGYPEGIYEVCMYIDGKLADSFSFELIK